MKKIIRLTESDLARIVKRVINEQGFNQAAMNTLIADANALIQPAAKLTFSAVANANKNTFSFGIDKISLTGDQNGTLSITYSTYGGYRATALILLPTDGKTVSIAANSGDKTPKTPTIQNLALVLQQSLGNLFTIPLNVEKNTTSLTTFLNAINNVIKKYQTSGVATAA
jgi:hypothetical protein